MISTLVVLVLFGLLLIVLETFVPGGFLGTLGVLSILAAVVVALASDESSSWSPAARTTVSIGIIVLSLIAVFIWLRFFAVKLFRRTFTLNAEIRTAPNPSTSLIGRQGIAITELRPLGRVELDDDAGRYEVRALNGFTPVGTRILVIATEPGNLVVRVV